MREAGKLKVRKGDLVQVLAGKDRGKQGRIVEARPDEGRVVVENVNIVKRHQRPRPVKGTGATATPQIEPGGVITKPAPLDVSNVMLVCPVCKKPTRIGYTFKEVKGEKRKVRVCRRPGCGQEIDR